MRLFCGADSTRARGDVHPNIYKWLGTAWGTMSRRTANKKLTKLHWPSPNWRKCLPKRLLHL